MGNDLKAKRRAELGDKSGISQSNATFAGAPPSFLPQPRPGLGQDQTGGNVQNYVHEDDGQGNTGQRIGGAYSYPYGDMGMDPAEAIARGARGAVGPLAVSGEFQGLGQSYGLKNNQQMNMHSSPKEKTARMMEGMSLIASALQRGQALGSGKRPDGSIQPAPYQPGPMGMHNYPGPLEGGQSNIGQVEYTTPQQSQQSLGLQGLQSAEAAVAQGMNMGTGQRNTLGT